MTARSAGATRGRIELRGVSKVFGPTHALADFSHVFAPGRVHALMGKNGSGKSTLVKILAGAVQPSEGELHVNGEAVAFASPADALAAGIVTVHQELSLVPTLSVGENIYLGRLPHRRLLGARPVDWRRVHDDSARLLHEMGLDIDPHLPVGRLSVGQQQVIEIVKAMSFDPSILLLDEPTSALAAREVHLLFDLMRRLRARGVTMIYITHRMNELFEIADTCTVLRDGRGVGDIAMTDATPDRIVEMMFGDIARAVRPPRRAIGRGKPVLEVRSLTRKPAFENVSFDLHRGEVLGFAGMLGAGRTEILRAIFGADRRDSGEIRLDGRIVPHADPKTMKRLGLGYTPENRKEVGLVQILSVHDNLCLASLARISPNGIMTQAREAPFVARQIDGLAIKASNPMLPVSRPCPAATSRDRHRQLAEHSAKVMFFDEPSRGIDVQAKQQVFDIMWREAERGLSSIFVSSEPENCSMSPTASWSCITAASRRRCSRRGHADRVVPALHGSA